MQQRQSEIWSSYYDVEENADIKSDDGILTRIVDINQKLSDLASDLKYLAEREDFSQKPISFSTALNGFRFIIKSRRHREKFFNANLFSDPAWDILLDLSIARIENREIAISSLCIAACVPTTTAMRWIRHLENHELIQIKPDLNDKRRHIVRISDSAFERMIKIINIQY